MKDYFFEDGKFNIRNYSSKPPFTNFLPGIAGVDGCPLWAFYINRGQGIAGFGSGGKGTPIAEFSPAEIAYANAPRQGFRTFLLIDKKPYEPFGICSKKRSVMQIFRSGFAIEETASKCRIRVEYFGVPNRSYAALARIVYYTNTTQSEQKLEYLDGLAQILPYGISNGEFKSCGNLLKSWATVKALDEGFAYIKMRSSTSDSSDVCGVSGGNFFISKSDETVVDPRLVFGEDRTKTSASAFNRSGIDKSALETQCRDNGIFCAFTHGERKVKAGETVAVFSLTGYANNIDCAREIKKNISLESMLGMQKEAEKEAEKIAGRVATHTAFPLFDEYIGQSYFDNVLRGGMPTVVGGRPYYIFSRKHGDPERDYNEFYIEPKPYSCGNGNFRDIAQNRRNDIFVTPECGDFNIKYFFSLLQTDGYNPLCVNGVRYTLREVPEKWLEYKDFLNGRFSVGDAVVKLGLDRAQTDELISLSEPVCEAAFGEGYWSDHFVYLIDLVTAYLAVCPEKREELLHKSSIGWFRSSAKLLPPERRAVLTKDNKIRRLYSLEKSGEDGWAEIGGKPYKTTLATKLLFLVLIKLCTLDPVGCGIDMEAGKPGWCDALNGLPALFGSNVADSLELLRLCQTLREIEIWRGGEVEWAEEQNELFESVLKMLDGRISCDEFYFETLDAKQRYLNKAYGNFTGKTQKVRAEEIEKFLSLAAERLKDGHERAKRLGDGWYPTYLKFEVTDFEETADGYIKCKKFKPTALPHFAEGVAKGLIYDGVNLFNKAKNSDMYDKKLKLFKTSESLDKETIEIGRIRSFPSGWLERESCFLHMSYKLLLALLKAGLYDEFYSEIKSGLVAFMPSERYGRSTLENSSFIVTSNYGSPSNHGKGYQARLTGANAEVISMWRNMFGIERPFTFDDGVLKFSLSPKLKKEFFDDGKVTFRLFSKTDITYINLSGRDTYKDTQISEYRLFGDKVTVTEEVTGELAENVRSGKYKKIEVVIK